MSERRKYVFIIIYYVTIVVVIVIVDDDDKIFVFQIFRSVRFETRQLLFPTSSICVWQYNKIYKNRICRERFSTAKPSTGFCATGMVQMIETFREIDYRYTEPRKNHMSNYARIKFIYYSRRADKVSLFCAR